LVSQRDTVHQPVPEDDVLPDDTVFADSNAQAASIAAGQAARQQQKQRSGLMALLTCSCFSDPSVPEVSDSRNASGMSKMHLAVLSQTARTYGRVVYALHAGSSVTLHGSHAHTCECPMHRCAAQHCCTCNNALHSCKTWSEHSGGTPFQHRSHGSAAPAHAPTDHHSLPCSSIHLPCCILLL
jgi:hypothetical protein